MKMRSLFVALLLLGATGVSAPAGSLASEPAFRVFGQVQTPKVFNVRALQKLPDSNQNVTYFAAGSIVSHTFTGALLWDLLQSVGISSTRSSKTTFFVKPSL